jgi:hypothetical protein
MNALSLPTWTIHVSSVIEWMMAIVAIAAYGDKIGMRSWYALSWGMLPALVSAMCACTLHFYDNDTSLAWLVTLQAAMTCVGNATMCAAAWWIYRQERVSDP